MGRIASYLRRRDGQAEIYAYFILVAKTWLQQSNGASHKPLNMIEMRRS